MVDDGRTGLVLPGTDAARWSQAIAGVLDDDAGRTRMARAAVQWMGRYSLQRTFEAFWAEHLSVAEPPEREHEQEGAPVPAPAGSPVGV